MKNLANYVIYDEFINQRLKGKYLGKVFDNAYLVENLWIQQAKLFNFQNSLFLVKNIEKFIPQLDFYKIHLLHRGFSYNLGILRVRENPDDPNSYLLK